MSLYKNLPHYWIQYDARGEAENKDFRWLSTQQDALLINHQFQLIPNNKYIWGFLPNGLAWVDGEGVGTRSWLILYNVGLVVSKARIL